MAVKDTLRARWFWYSILCVVLWGPFMIASKLGSREIPAPTMQFLFTIGSLPILAGLVSVTRFRLEKNVRGIAYGTAAGILAGLGGVGLFAAYGTGGSTTVITAVSSLYPMVTVVLAVLILREHLTWVHVTGLVFAAVALILFSL